MAISEEARHRMYGRLEEVLGREEAAVLMEHLPPVGWADVATRRDLDHLAEVFGARSDALEARLQSRSDAVAARLGEHIVSAAAATRADMRMLFLGLLALQLSGAGLAVGVLRFA